MPLYDYRCTNRRCELYSTIVELEKPMTSVVIPVCEMCEHELVRIWSTPAVTFKGSGFYRNDSRVKHESASVKVGGNGDKES